MALLTKYRSDHGLREVTVLLLPTNVLPLKSKFNMLIVTQPFFKIPLIGEAELVSLIISCVWYSEPERERQSIHNYKAIRLRLCNSMRRHRERWIELYCDAEVLIDICVHCTPFPCWQVNNANSSAGLQNVAAYRDGIWDIRSQKADFYNKYWILYGAGEHQTADCWQKT